ncbi:uncharacterized protein FOMMEDRAFT_163650 [Fomitiporia mediterranea MF3/22]|uniref:Uncharacterized protein n=1 Tax=Fomitiporia mediterranea (strain MF3/22) TaxID=694068 RepID=R7SFA2_FOMME|nr:uncharacterized protein FOMMEDRAFT_163650 [Fomitiporia mediterranea MF3/22]EJC97383.1 hypothetical protein FOMMEDRAFT_163650 [Fomitiporia mediterranea MF3/22]
MLSDHPEPDWDLVPDVKLFETQSSHMSRNLSNGYSEQRTPTTLYRRSLPNRIKVLEYITPLTMPPSSYILCTNSLGPERSPIQGSVTHLMPYDDGSDSPPSSIRNVDSSSSASIEDYDWACDITTAATPSAEKLPAEVERFLYQLKSGAALEVSMPMSLYSAHCTEIQNFIGSPVVCRPGSDGIGYIHHCDDFKNRSILRSPACNTLSTSKSWPEGKMPYSMHERIKAIFSEAARQMINNVVPGFNATTKYSRDGRSYQLDDNLHLLRSHQPRGNTHPREPKYWIPDVAVSVDGDAFFLIEVAHTQGTQDVVARVQNWFLNNAVRITMGVDIIEGPFRIGTMAKDCNDNMLSAEEFHAQKHLNEKLGGWYWTVHGAERVFVGQVTIEVFLAWRMRVDGVWHIMTRGPVRLLSRLHFYD